VVRIKVWTILVDFTGVGERCPFRYSWSGAVIAEKVSILLGYLLPGSLATERRLS
jgi:hypothetical protein